MSITSVHIPIHDDNPLTLKTIKVGFPTLPVTTYDCRGDFKTNDKLIEYLVNNKTQGFAVVDSDVVFFENCEDFEPRDLIAGEFIPEFVCPIAKAITHSRLHTAFFVVSNPVKLRHLIGTVYNPMLPKFCPFNPFVPVVTFQDRKPYFYDSCSVLYHAIGGENFEPNMLRRFEHLYGGSYMTGPHRDRINAAYENPESARGVREMMTKYFDERKP